MGDEAQEMTLDEWVARLPKPHRAHDELRQLRADLRDANHLVGDMMAQRDEARRMAVLQGRMLAQYRKQIEGQAETIARQWEALAAEPVYAPSAVVMLWETWRDCDGKCGSDCAEPLLDALRTARLRPESEVRAAERERCARLCERPRCRTWTPEECAEQIRALGDGEGGG